MTCCHLRGTPLIKSWKAGYFRGALPLKIYNEEFHALFVHFYRQNYFLLLDRFDPFLSYMILQLFITLSCKFYLFLKHLLYKNMVVMMTSL